MTAIPDGGWAEVEWGVRWISENGQHVDNLSHHHASGRDQERARQIVGAIPKPGLSAKLVAREVTYGPWVDVEP